MDIHTAVISDNLEAVKQHIKAGTDLNAKDAMSGSSALITAATFNKVEIAKALINAGADLSVTNNDGATALHTAAFFGRIEIVQLLIDAKADKTIKNVYGHAVADQLDLSIGDTFQSSHGLVENTI
ncbi:MAG: ankyrin repeat domain-containing protein, partial [Psychroserpens sp.]|nr:ankyrin repeat domain-containing protein [Psychroserpens sp.]